MITPSYSITATERVLPNLALDFTTASLDARVTLTRALNTATCFGSNGYLSVINANLPRFDYDPVTLACKGLLIEEARTNVQTYSGDFTNAAWTKASSTITANATTDLFGGNTGQLLLETAATSYHGAYSFSTAASTTYSATAFVKKQNNRYATLGSIWSPSFGIAVQYDLNTSTVVYSFAIGAGYSVISSSITSVGNNVFKITMTFSVGAQTSSFYVGTTPSLITSGTIDQNTYAGNTANGIYLLGSQLEVGAFATSLVPTTSAALTRNADNASMTSTNFSSWFNATEGAFVANVQSKNGAYSLFV